VYDHFANAARVARLGCGRVLPRPRYNAKTAVRELQMLLADQSYSVHATEVRKVVSQEQGACVAADEIEKVLKAS